MKLRKLMSLAVTAAMVMTSMAMSVPMASAETVNTSDRFFEDFEGFTDTVTSITDFSKDSAVLQKLVQNYGWFLVDDNKYYTVKENGKLYSGITKFTSIVEEESGNKYLRLATPNQNKAYFEYGLGRPFPGQGANATGIWEINFKFKPYYGGSNNKVQFNFGMNTVGGDKTEKIAQHNIISAYDNKMYLGHRDYFVTYNNPGVPYNTLRDGNPEYWYDVKVIVNCDAHYYSVELRHGSDLVARRAAISFEGEESIGYLKLSALGMGAAHAVFIDDVEIKKVARETLICHEDFEEINNEYTATTGMTTGAQAEDTKGDSYFEGHTPWRAHSAVGNSYHVDMDFDLLSQAIRLGDDEETTEKTEGSGLVYMPACDTILTAKNQSQRGMLKTSFKIKPYNASGTVAVSAIASHEQDITSSNAVVFKIEDNNGTPTVVTDDGYVDLDSEKWYNVDLVFDVINKQVETTVTGIDTEETVAEFTKPTALNAVKGIMFGVANGATVYADDINIEYYAPAPVIDKNGIVLTDAFGNEVADINSVTPALKSIKIPVGCTVKPVTASAETIKLRDQNGNEVTYAPSRVDNAYTLLLDKLLAPNTTYTVTIPKTLANTFGDELGKDFTLTFKTTNALPYLMNISAVKLGGQEVTELSQISAGSTINVETEYANSTAEAIDGTVIIAFYSEDKMEAVLTKDTTIASGACGKDTATFAFDVPEELDMTNVSKVSVMLWDGFSEITPYCGSVDIPAQAE